MLREIDDREAEGERGLVSFLLHKGTSKYVCSKASRFMNLFLVQNYFPRSFIHPEM